NMAVGLSKQGYIPVVDTFAQFGITKGALPLIMSGLSQGPIIGIYSHTGFQDAADGASHQALTYFAMTAAIPNVDVICLTCADEAYALVSQAIERFSEDRKKGKTPRSTLFFLGRETYPASFAENADYTYGKSQVVMDQTDGHGQSVVLAVTGSLLENALFAQKELAKAGLGSIVVNQSMINHPDTETFSAALQKTNGHVVTIEDHRVVGGAGALLCHALSQKGIPFKMKSLGIQDHFGRSAYTSDQLYEKFGLGVSAIVKASQDLLNS
ncbi:MAG: transketolase C-terminal domain-containing protein, partial [Pseudomonadota bacterium]